MRHIRVLVGLLPAAFLLNATWAPASTFSTIDFPESIGTAAVGISNVGHIVGEFADAAKRFHGFLLAGGKFSTIDFPGAFATSPKDVNSSGQIVGVYADSAGKIRGFLLAEGRFTTINFPQAAETAASHINDVGVITGSYADAAGKRHGFLLSGGGFRTIDYPGAKQTIAGGINASGHVAGAYQDARGNYHGFLLIEGHFTTIDFPGASTTGTYGINDRGQIVGDYTDAAGISHGFLLTAGSFSTIDFPSAVWTTALGLNNQGQVVGAYQDSRGNRHGFLLGGETTLPVPGGTVPTPSTGAQAPSSPPGQAPSVERPTWMIGDTWMWRLSSAGEVTYTVHEITKDGYSVQTKGPAAVLKSVMSAPVVEFNAKLIGGDFFFAVEEWPLEQGKTWTRVNTSINISMGTASSSTVRTTSTVAAPEPVTVPAGTFVAVRIEGKECNETQQSQCGEFTVWFAPQVKHLIKIAWSGSSYWPPSLRGRQLELFSYQVH